MERRKKRRIKFPLPVIDIHEKTSKIIKNKGDYLVPFIVFEWSTF